MSFQKHLLVLNFLYIFHFKGLAENATISLLLQVDMFYKNIYF